MESVTLDELKKIIVKHNHRSWARFIKELEKLHIPAKQNNFEIIRKQIEQYKPVRFYKKNIVFVFTSWYNISIGLLKKR